MFKPRVVSVRFVVVAMVCALVLPGVSIAKVVSPDFVELAKNLNPVVVNIRTAKNIVPKQKLRRPQHQNPFGNNFFDEFFNRYFDEMPQQKPRREQSLGTGF
ncbi:MAG: peptidase, partial [Desulfuromonadales bacterium]